MERQSDKVDGIDGLSSRDKDRVTKEQFEALKKKYYAGGGAGGPPYPAHILPMAITCLAVALWDLLSGVQEGTVKPLASFATVFVTYFAIDVFSGIFHIVLDNPAFADNKAYYNVIQPLAAGFQEHHLDVTLIYRMPLLEHLRPMSLPSMFCFATGKLFTQLSPNDDPGRLFTIFHLSVTAFLILMQLAHRWSHIINPEARPWGVTTLQRWGLLVSASEHRKHHQVPYEAHFCILSGSCNPLMNQLVKVLPPLSTHWLEVFVLAFFVPYFILQNFV
jgi:ubiquitin-conjugating enzyme E2 variant